MEHHNFREEPLLFPPTPDKLNRSFARSIKDCITGLRVMYIDMNSFYAKIEQNEHPELRGKPVIVVQVIADSTSAIAASPEAKALGIKTGTSVREAKRISPGVHVIKASHALYTSYHHRFVDILDGLFPSNTPRSIDEVSCRAQVSQFTCREVRELASAFRHKVYNQLGDITCSIGVGPNVFTAKIAADLKKPNGLTILSNRYPYTLSKLPLLDLPGIGERTAERLNQKGIKSVTDLYKASALQLETAFGSIHGRYFYYHLRGSLEFDYQRESQAEVKSAHASRLCYPDFTLAKDIQILQKLLVLDRIRYLKTLKLVPRCITVGLTGKQKNDHNVITVFQRSASVPVPTTTEATWLAIIDDATKLLTIPSGMLPGHAYIEFREITAEKAIPDLPLIDSPFAGRESHGTVNYEPDCVILDGKRLEPRNSFKPPPRVKHTKDAPELS